MGLVNVYNVNKNDNETIWFLNLFKIIDRITSLFQKNALFIFLVK